MEIVFFNYI